MGLFHVSATLDVGYEIFIEAKDEDEAWELAKDEADGWIKTDTGHDWTIEHISPAKTGNAIECVQGKFAQVIDDNGNVTTVPPYNGPITSDLIVINSEWDMAEGHTFSTEQSRDDFINGLRYGVGLDDWDTFYTTLLTEDQSLEEYNEEHGTNWEMRWV